MLPPAGAVISPFLPRMLRLVVRSRALRKLSESVLQAMVDSLDKGGARTSSRIPKAAKEGSGVIADESGTVENGSIAVSAKHAPAAASGAGGDLSAAGTITPMDAAAVPNDSALASNYNPAPGRIMARPCQVSSATGRVVVTEPSMQALPVAKGTPIELRAAPPLEPGATGVTSSTQAGKLESEALDGDLGYLWECCRNAVRPVPSRSLSTLGAEEGSLIRPLDGLTNGAGPGPGWLTVCIDYS